MIEIFKSRKSSMVIIGLILLTVIGLIRDYDVTKEIVTLIAIYVTGNVAQKATQKEVQHEERDN